MITPPAVPAKAFLFHRLAWSLLFILTAVRLMSAAPAVPSNDSCGTAELISLPPQQTKAWSVPRDISGATTNGDPALPSCYEYDPADLSRSIWYRFVPPFTGQYTISSCADAPTATTVPDTVMGIYTNANGCFGTMVEIPNGCADDSCGPSFRQAAITTTLSVGLTYYIVVWRYGTAMPSPDDSTLQLLVEVAAAPANDACQGAIALTLNRAVQGKTMLASNDYELAASCFTGSGQPVTAAGGRDVAYSFTAPATAEYSFRVSNFNVAQSDPILYVIGSCPSGPRPITITSCLAVASRVPVNSVEEIYCLPLLANQQVFVIVDDTETNSLGSSFILEALLCNREKEPNDTTATACSILCGIEGSIDTDGDVDIYSLGIPAVGSRLFALADGAALFPSDLTMRVITANGTSEFDGANNDDAFGGFSSNVAGTPLTNVPTYLRINSDTRREPYRLFAVIQPPLASATLESEPNNFLGQANHNENNYFYGSLAGPSPSADLDSYEFEAAQGDVIFISLDGDPLRNNTPLNAALELLDESGNVLARVDDPSASESIQNNTSTNSVVPYSPGEALVYRAINSGTYFARISVGYNVQGDPQPGSAGAGDYLLSITRNCIPGNVGQPPRPTVEAIIPLPNGHFQLTALGVPGVTYRVEWAPALGSPWTPLAGCAPVANGDGTFQIEDTMPGPQQRFYRIVWP